MKFWLSASELQRRRCLTNPFGSDAARADINFYVVAVQRLREVARLCVDRAGLAEVSAILQEFDNEWPRFRELRNLEEHTTGTGADEPPYGIWYFNDVVAELGYGGVVDYLVRVEDMQVSARKLTSKIEMLIAKELEK